MVLIVSPDYLKERIDIKRKNAIGRVMKPLLDTNCYQPDKRQGMTFSPTHIFRGSFVDKKTPISDVKNSISY